MSTRYLALGGAILLLSLAGIASVQKITLESPALRSGVMSKRYAAFGKDMSPPLIWSNVPSRALELVLIFEEVETGRVHWLLYRIPGTALGLREDLPQEEVLSEPAKLSGTIQGLTDFKDLGPGYHGPNPPEGKETRYRFLLYALDTRLGLLPGLDKASLMSLIQDHIIGAGELIVTCRR